jgi:hypothetical protein
MTGKRQHCTTTTTTTNNNNNSDKSVVTTALYIGSWACPAYYLVVTRSRGTN